MLNGRRNVLEYFSCGDRVTFTGKSIYLPTIINVEDKGVFLKY